MCTKSVKVITILMNKDTPSKKMLEEIDGKKIKEDNRLIKATAKMTTNSQKLFETAVAAIDPESEDVNVVRVKKEIMFEALKLKGHNRNNRLTAALGKLADDASFVYTEIIDGRQVDTKIKPVYSIRNNHGLPYSEIKFAPEIMKLLIDLHNRFTRYPLEDILKMEKAYSIPIYRWLLMYFNQYEYYMTTNKRTVKQLDTYLNPKIEVDDLRKLTGTLDKYKDYRNFKRVVLNEPMNEINEHSECISFEWHPIRTGKKVTAIQFNIKKKEAPIKEQQTESKDEVYNRAVNSRYTALLIANGLLMPLDVTKQKLIIELGTELYPLYEEFEGSNSTELLERHLRYLGKNKAAKIDNTPAYLNTALANYIKKLNADNDNTKKPKRRPIKQKETLPDWAKKKNNTPVQNSDKLSENKEGINEDIDELLRNLYPEE